MKFSPVEKLIGFAALLIMAWSIGSVVGACP
jgi:hypothetical protein